MNKGMLALALALVLAYPAAHADATHDRDPIGVSVAGGQVAVDQDDVVTVPEEGALVWRLTTSGYRFPESGIVIASAGLHRCNVVADGRAMRCVKLQHVPGARYKYTVNVIDSGSQQALPPLDPFITNR